MGSAVAADAEFKLFGYGKLVSSGLQMVYGDGEFQNLQHSERSHSFTGQAYLGGTPSFVKTSVNISRKNQENPPGDRNLRSQLS